MIARFTLAIALAAPALLAQEARAPLSPVTRQEVWQAVAGELRERGVREEQMPRVEDLELPDAVPAAQGRTLRVVSACWDADLARTQFRVECREPGECIPFLAYLQTDGTRAIDRPIAESCRAGSRRASARPKKPAVRAGERAMVVFVANRLHLTASVICLERGAEGDIIRVKNQNGHTFRARVTAPALLEAMPQ
jgi:hypothetical protein